MNLWKLEWLRLLRTRRIMILFALFIVFGFGEPLLTRYLPDIINHSSNTGNSSIKVTVVSKPTAVQGFTAYANEAIGLGLIVTVIIAAYSLVIDTKTSLSTFYRTRTSKATTLLLPRYVIITAAIICAFIVGTLTAWYETTTLFGHTNFTDIIVGTLYISLYFMFVTAVVSFASSIVRSLMATVGLALGILILLPIAAVGSVTQWMPTTLPTALSDLLANKHMASYFIKPSLVAAGAIVLLLGGALWPLKTREIEE